MDAIIIWKDGRGQRIEVAARFDSVEGLTREDVDVDHGVHAKAGEPVG